MTRSCDTLLLSDLHLGTEASRAVDAIDLIRSYSFRRLILLGDIFSHLNFSKLSREHLLFLSEVRQVSNGRGKRDVIWVEGNHDVGLANVLSHLTGIPVYQRYVWEYQGIRHLALHGHQFDRFVSKNYLISRIGIRIYEELQKYDTQNKTFTNMLDRLSTRWLRLSDKVAEGAIEHARNGQAQRVFCGHTHAPVTRTHSGVEYINTGCWVDQYPTYVTVDEEGAHLHEYRAGTRNRHSSEERRELLTEPACLFEQAGLPAVRAYQSLLG